MDSGTARGRKSRYLDVPEFSKPTAKDKEQVSFLFKQ